MLEKEFLKFKKQIAKKNKHIIIYNYLKPYYEEITGSRTFGFGLAYFAYFIAKLENRLDGMNHLKRKSKR